MDAGHTAASEPGTGPGGTPAPSRAGIAWPAVLAGAGVGLVVLIVVATTRAVLDRRVTDFDESGWTLPLFVLLVAGYFAAGWVAQRRAAALGIPDAPFTHGTLAGIGAFVAWIPLRILIWLVRDERRGLVGGDAAALRPGQVFGGLVIAAGIGLLGGYLASRSARRDRSDDPDPSTGSGAGVEA
ncbi:MAG: hypothetical protein FJW95_11155 [Actinobacteria bacterium]|nr:hypothetical protein [Actinomycetota bacterium]